MAGFKVKKKLYLVKFADDTDLAGFEITMASVPTATLLELEDMTGDAEQTKKDTGSFRRICEIFAGALIGWNLEDDDDQPVPANFDGVGTLDPDVVMTIIMRWTQAISGVSETLGKDSTSGPQYPEASLPMAPLSPSRVS